MIKLRKRQAVQERIGSVIVLDMFNEKDKCVEYVGKEKFEKIMTDNADLLKHLDKPGFYTYMVVNPSTKKWKLYHNWTEILEDYKSFSMFTKEERSSFRYWFAHWCGFQLTALNLKIWKPRYLLHDIEKPWLRLFWKYPKVQKFHREHNAHHLEYGLLYGWDKINWEALLIDWECCALSKQNAQLDARETLAYEISKEKWKPYANEISARLEPLLDDLKL